MIPSEDTSRDRHCIYCYYRALSSKPIQSFSRAGSLCQKIAPSLTLKNRGRQSYARTRQRWKLVSWALYAAMILKDIDLECKLEILEAMPSQVVCIRCLNEQSEQVGKQKSFLTEWEEEEEEGDLFCPLFSRSKSQKKSVGLKFNKKVTHHSITLDISWIIGTIVEFSYKFPYTPCMVSDNVVYLSM